MESKIAEKAKGLLLRDCKYCSHYVSVDHEIDGFVELCKTAVTQGFSRMIYVRNKNKYGFSYLQIPEKRTCPNFEY